MIKLEWVLWLVAALFLANAVIRLTDSTDRKHVGGAAFWAVLAFTFAYGGQVKKTGASAFVEGIAVLALAVLAGVGFPGKGTRELVTDDEKVAGARRFGNKLFLPALLIPIIAVIFGSALSKVHIGKQLLLEDSSATIIGLGVASVVALFVAMVLFKVKSPATPFRESDRLLGHIGWAAILPQYLATLGILFTAAGVGKAVGKITGSVLPKHFLLAAVIVYCLGMLVFTVIMGNAFAAFPVMTAAVGWPILVQQYHGHPAPIFAIGMLAGFCGTLITPMAANFNLVPAALLELKDQYGPIKAQLPTAIPLWICNVALMYFLCFSR
ncbi:DUF979 domain-containing protein [Rudaeicoccus suwonensis]|uniref:Putative membrane protein n=1 Tax=Rudaeicoccus suwonensis TaxID=657409 RepID=A0A561E6K9_9MICO|nr:DUF979 domain-containing protein [Rudaeicoccus suwonensis]TWE11258.1 putative membrane protein [Rudaeicoccus suwonensis]